MFQKFVTDSLLNKGLNNSFLNYNRFFFQIQDSFSYFAIRQTLIIPNDSQ